MQTSIDVKGDIGVPDVGTWIKLHKCPAKVHALKQFMQLCKGQYTVISEENLNDKPLGLNMFVHNPLLLKTQLPGNETTWANYTGKEWKPFVIKTSDTEIERAIFPHNKLGLSLELYVDWNWSLDIPSPILWLFIFIYVKSKMQTNNIIVLLLFYLCLSDSAS